MAKMTFEQQIGRIRKDNTERVKMTLLRSNKLYSEVKDMGTDELKQFCIEYAKGHEDALGDTFVWELEDDMAIDWQAVREGL